MMAETALSLFCIAPTHAAAAIAVSAAGGDDDILKVSLDELTAWVAEVRRDDFEGPDAEQRLQDLSWVGPRALRHGDVIARIMRGAPVLPVGFGTLFSSREALLEFMERNRAEIGEFLETVSGAEEWAVKVLFTRTDAKERLFQDLVAEHAEELASKPPGVRYFKEQQLRSLAEKEIGSRLKAVCAQVADNLHACCRDSVNRPVSALSSIASEVAETVANWAFLVDSDRVRDFLAAVERANREFAEQGVAFQASGPWPPYSFGPSLVSVAEQ